MHVRRLLFVFVAMLCVAAVSQVRAATRLVLFEEATQWNCPPCASANPYVQQFLAANASNIIGIRYHAWWPDANDDPMYLHDQSNHATRINYYGISGVPSGMIDGQLIPATSQAYAGYPGDINHNTQLMNARLGVSTPLTLTATESLDSNGNIKIHIVANSTQDFSGNYRLRVAVVKEEVDSGSLNLSPYRNGETVFENVVQKMLPDANGTTFTISANNDENFDFSYSADEIMATGNFSKIFIVAWIQDDNTKEVINACTDLNTGTNFVSGPMNINPPDSRIAEAGQTTMFPSSLHNNSNATAVFQTFFTSSSPSSWQVNYSVDGKTYTDTAAFSVQGNQTFDVDVNCMMTGGKGICLATLHVNKIVGDTLYPSVYKYCSASSDVNTMIIDGTGGTKRASVYQSALNPINNVIQGTITSDFSTSLIPNDTTLKTIVYVAGSKLPTDNDFSILTSFLQNGGNLLLTGETIYTLASINRDAIANNFLTNALHTSGVVTGYINGNVSYPVYETGQFRGFTGVTGDSVSGSITSSNIVAFNGSNRNDNTMLYVPDAIKPMSDGFATSIFTYTGTDTVCGVRVEPPSYAGNYKAVYLAFGLEAMANTTMRNKLMNNIIAWFNSSQVGVQTPLPNATDFSLSQNYPNPFNEATQISFTLPRTERVNIAIYNSLGERVSTVMDEIRPAGANSVAFDGANLPAGVYEYRMTAPSGVVSRRMSFVKK